MRVSKEVLLYELPADSGPWVMVKESQTVPDIIDLIVARHKDFANDYDLIAPYFIGRNIDATCENLYNFCIDNLRYKEETEHFQSVGNPASIIARGSTGVDCKSYALFIGGCLDAIQRITGKKIDWFYRFASYELDETTPYHVFICVDTGNELLYVDPTPGSAGKEPVWIVDERIKNKSVAGFGSVNETIDLNCGCIGAASPQPGALIPAPSWYPGYLPLFYRQSNGQILCRPINSVPNYTENDVLDVCLYYQTIIGYNRIDVQNARSAAWQYTNGSGGARIWAQSVLKSDGAGNGSGDWAAVSPNGQSIDGAFYAKLQQRYITNESAAKPWLASMQAKGGGIDLMTIPMATDIEQPRPTFYPAHLPSLFKSSGQPYQQPLGFMDAKPKIRNGASSGYTAYQVTPDDIAYLMLYAQPIIIDGPTPYPINWYVNDDVNGAMANYFKITLQTAAGHTNAQEQQYGINGDLMKYPVLDANPYASGFTQTLEKIVSAAINFFAGKIPGGSIAIKAGYAAGTVGGGEVITGGPIPSGQFSAAVFAAADKITAGLKQSATNKKILWIVVAAAAGLTWYYWDDIKKQFKK